MKRHILGNNFIPKRKHQFRAGNSVRLQYLCWCYKFFITGVNCEMNFDNALCTQYPHACANGGLCRDGLGNNHISCECNSAFGLFGSTENQVSETCQLLSRQFKHGDFLMLPGITNQWHFTLSIRYEILNQIFIILSGITP